MTYQGGRLQVSVEIGTGGSQSLGLVGGSEAGERGPGNGSACAVSQNCRFGRARYANWLLTSVSLSNHLLIICGNCTDVAGHRRGGVGSSVDA